MSYSHKCSLVMMTPKSTGQCTFPHAGGINNRQLETPAATFPWRSTPSVACSLKEESKLILFLHASVTKPEAKDVQGSCSIMMGRGRVMRDNLWGKYFAKSRELVLLLNLLCPQRTSLPYYSIYYKENGLLL